MQILFYLVFVFITFIVLNKGFTKVPDWSWQKKTAHSFYVIYLIIFHCYSFYLIGYILPNLDNINQLLPPTPGIPDQYKFIFNYIIIIIGAISVFMGFMLAGGKLKLPILFISIPFFFLRDLIYAYMEVATGLSESYDFSAQIPWGPLLTILVPTTLILFLIYFFMHRFYSRNYFGPR
ncbi:MAG: hypothetical protein R3257_06135 [bacterium]|nr:hypothetical protein [bacterium]